MACHAQMLKRYNKQSFTPLADYIKTEQNRRELRRQGRDKLKKISQTNQRYPRGIENQISHKISYTQPSSSTDLNVQDTQQPSKRQTE